MITIEKILDAIKEIDQKCAMLLELDAKRKIDYSEDVKQVEIEIKDLIMEMESAIERFHNSNVLNLKEKIRELLSILAVEYASEWTSVNKEKKIEIADDYSVIEQELNALLVEINSYISILNAADLEVELPHISIEQPSDKTIVVRNTDTGDKMYDIAISRNAAVSSIDDGAKVQLKRNNSLTETVVKLFVTGKKVIESIDFLVEKFNKEFKIADYKKVVKASADVWLKEKQSQYDNEYAKKFYDLFDSPIIREKYDDFFNTINSESEAANVDLVSGTLAYNSSINIGDANCILTPVPERVDILKKCESLSGRIDFQDLKIDEDTESGKVEIAKFNTPVILDLKKRGNIVIGVDNDYYDTEVIEFVNQLIIQFLMSFPANRIKFNLVDVGNKMGFSPFKVLTKINTGILVDGIIRDDRKFDDSIKDMEQRMYTIEDDKLSLNGVEDVFEYNSKFDAAPQDVYLFVLSDSPNGLKSDTSKRIIKLLQNGNKCGIFTIIIHNKNATVDTLFKQPDYKAYVESLQKDALYFDYTSEQFRLELGVGKSRTRFIFTPKKDIKVDLLPGIVETLCNNVEASKQKVIPLMDMFDYTDSLEKSGKVKVGPEHTLDIPIGMSGGEIQTLRLMTSGGSAHAVAIGGTGSGKSNLLHAIIMNACYRYSPEELNFYLVDFKGGVEFKFYEANKNRAMQLPHVRLTGLTSDLNDGVSILINLQNVLHDRERLFRDNGVEDIIQFKKNGHTLPRLVVIIDEIQELFERDETLGQKAINILSELCKKGRAFGINILWASQNVPHVPGLKAKVLSQIGNKISLRLNNPEDAQDLDMDINAIKGLNRPEKGLGIIKDERYGNDSREFRVVYAENSETREKFVQVILDKWSSVIKTKNFEPLFIVGGDTTPSPVEANTSYSGEAFVMDKQSEYSIELGRDYITGKPCMINFGANDKENLIVLGTDIEVLRDIAGYSLLSTVMNCKTDINFKNEPAAIFCANGEIIKADNRDDLLNVVKEDFADIIENSFNTERLMHTIADLHEVYKARSAEAEESEEERIFVPYYVIIHNFQRYAEAFNSNKPLPSDDSMMLDFGSSFSSKASKTGVADAFKELYIKGGKFGIHFVITMDTPKTFGVLSKDILDCRYKIVTKGVNLDLAQSIFNDARVTSSLTNPQVALLNDNGERTKISLYRYDSEVDSKWYEALRDNYKKLD